MDYISNNVTSPARIKHKQLTEAAKIALAEGRVADADAMREKQFSLSGDETKLIRSICE